MIEIAGLGPAPFATMLLSDLGADVLRIDRPGATTEPADPTGRGRARLSLDLKVAADQAMLWRAIERADVLIEGFRPGVMERLGLGFGPDPALARNPRLIYARMTGWGQAGPRAATAGHDLTYIALTGALHAIGPAGGPPVPPLNLVGDYGGGALYLIFGVCAALYERERSGAGQVIDAAIVDGTVSLMAIFHWLAASGLQSMAPGAGLLSGAAPYYRCYRCQDGRFVAVAALEPQFYAALLGLLGLEPDALGHQLDQSAWPKAHARLEAIFLTRPRDAWAAAAAATDACLAPVLNLEEAANEPHLVARGVLVEAFGRLQPAPAPRFSRTPGAIQGPPPASDEDGIETLRRWEG